MYQTFWKKVARKIHVFLFLRIFTLERGFLESRFFLLLEKFTYFDNYLQLFSIIFSSIILNSVVFNVVTKSTDGLIIDH